MVKRTKIEESIIREILSDILSFKYDIILPGKQDDWNHSDIIVKDKETNNEFFIDVKRSNSSNFTSNNFTFTFVNKFEKEYPFKENGYFMNDFIVLSLYLKSAVYHLKI